MKKYLLLFAAVAVLAGCEKDEIVEHSSIEGTATKAYSLTVDLMAGQYHHAGTVNFYDPTDGNGGPLEVTVTLNQDWSMSELHFYAGATGDMPVNKPGNPKIGKFPHKEENISVTGTYIFQFPLGNVTLDDFAIAFHAVVDKPTGGNETAWAQGDKKFRDKGWGTYISDFYASSNYVPNDLYAIQTSVDGSINLILIDGNTGTNDLIYTEEITGSNGNISGAGYDEQTGYLFFIFDDNLYANNLNNDDPSTAMTSINSANISGTTFNDGNYYYYNTSDNHIVEVSMTYDANAGWSYDGEETLSGQMLDDSFTVTDISSYNNTIYLIGVDGENSTNPVNLLEFDIPTETFGTNLQPTVISSQVTTPTIAAGPESVAGDPDLYSFDIGTETGTLYLVQLDEETGNTSGNPEAEEPEDPVIIGR